MTRIGILGTRMMGTTLGRRLASAGHPVLFGARRPEEASALAETLEPTVQGRRGRGGILR